MEAVRYRVSDTAQQRVVFVRRYLPSQVLRLGLVVVAVGVLISSTSGHAQPAYAVAVWIAIFGMSFYRRSETLTIDLQPDGTGTRLTVIGHASKTAAKVLEEVLFHQPTRQPESAMNL